MATRSRGGGGGIVGAVKVDLQRLYGAWMELVFPRQLVGHSVLGKWRPETPVQKIGYYAWGIVGIVGLLLMYPLTVLGFATRYYAGKLDSTATRLGIAGVAGLAVLVWGALTVVAYIRIDTVSFEGFAAILVASVVATISASLAALFSKIGGRGTTVALAYPFGVTGVFLPPVVAAFYHPALADTIFTRNEAIAEAILDNILFVGGLNDLIREQFDLEGMAHALMWFVVSFPVGWFLGGVVALANLVRPSSD